MLGRQIILDVPSAILAAAALVLLVRFKIKEPILVAAGAVIGVAFLH